MPKELNKEELETVSGGTQASPDYIPASDRGIHINQYYAGQYLNKYVYIIQDSNNRLIVKGILKNSYDATISCKKRRVHKLEVTDRKCTGSGIFQDSENHAIYPGYTCTFYGADWTIHYANIQNGNIPAN